jgi:tartrate dehydratase alpha subunit/fumarate hydratase class I-like protein
VQTALKRARDNEPSELCRSVLGMLLDNHRMACDERLASCQDPGMALGNGSLERRFSLDRTFAVLLTQEGPR